MPGIKYEMGGALGGVLSAWTFNQCCVEVLLSFGAALGLVFSLMVSLR